MEPEVMEVMSKLTASMIFAGHQISRMTDVMGGRSCECETCLLYLPSKRSKFTDGFQNDNRNNGLDSLTDNGMSPARRRSISRYQRAETEASSETLLASASSAYPKNSKQNVPSRPVGDLKFEIEVTPAIEVDRSVESRSPPFPSGPAPPSADDDDNNTEIVTPAYTIKSPLTSASASTAPLFAPWINNGGNDNGGFPSDSSSMDPSTSSSSHLSSSAAVTNNVMNRFRRSSARSHELPVLLSPFSLQDHHHDCYQQKGVRRFNCPECGREFNSKTNMVKHRYRMHLCRGKDFDLPKGMNKNQCPECGKQFNSRSNMMTHRFRMHLAQSADSSQL